MSTFIMGCGCRYVIVDDRRVELVDSCNTKPALCGWLRYHDHRKTRRTK